MSTTDDMSTSANSTSPDRRTLCSPCMLSVLEKVIHPKDQWATSHIYGTLQTFQRLARSPKLLFVSDGSFRAGICTSASFVSNGVLQASSSNVIPGGPTDSSPYRGELGGIIGSLQLLDILDFLHPKERDITIALDGASALEEAEQAPEGRISAPSFDLLQDIAIRKARHKSLRWQWVRGHQSLSSESPLEVRLNHMCDALAKSRLDDPIPGPSTFQRGWSLLLGGQKCSSITVSEIYDWAMDHSDLSSHSYWSTKSRLPREVYDSIDLLSLQSAVSVSTFSTRRWYLKFASGFCGTNSREFLRNNVTSAKCPRCPHPDETVFHVLSCHGCNATSIWNQQLQSLDTWFVSSNTDPAICRSVISNLNGWFFHSPVSTPGGLYCQSAVDHQTAIGWDHFLLGRISPQWREAQQLWFDSLQSKQSSHLWASKFIRQIWQIAHSLWRHCNKIKHAEDYVEDPNEVQSVRAEAKALWKSLSPESRRSIPVLQE